MIYCVIGLERHSKIERMIYPVGRSSLTNQDVYVSCWLCIVHSSRPVAFVGQIKLFLRFK